MSVQDSHSAAYQVIVNPEDQKGASKMTQATWPPKFTLDTSHLLQLFVGERFYSSADAAIREAVLNAIDACGRRAMVEPGASCEIKLIFDEQANTMTISDNGDGMGKEELSQLFSKVGSSASELAKQDSQDQYDAVGEFGIGVISYFLVCDQFEVHTVRVGSEEPLGLKFDRSMLDGEESASSVPAKRKEPGTTVEFVVRDSDLLVHLIEKYSYWVRDVPGLQATKLPTGEEIPQGGLSKKIMPVDVEFPEWIERARLGPPTSAADLVELDGNGHVDVLYRGVFVDRVDVNALWGVEGTIDVDPRQFKHRLNREGFVGSQLQEQVTRFLQLIHPRILESALEVIVLALANDSEDYWPIHRRATLWLAIPRSEPYLEVANSWDAIFWDQKVFRLLEGSERAREVSLSELEAIDVDKFYLAPQKIQRASVLARQAIRILRARGEPVVQGILRDASYLRAAPMTGSSTSDLLINQFSQRFPDLIQAESVAQELVSGDAEATIFDQEPTIVIVKLGADAAPLVSVGNAVWINMEVDQGKSIIEEILRLNQGHLGLWVACLKHAPSHAHEIADRLGSIPDPPVRLGLVRRQYLRGFLE